MILTEQEIDDLSREMVKGCKSVSWLAQKIESAVLERLKAQEPVATRLSNGIIDPEYGKEIPIGAMLYLRPLPPDDVVRDAARYKWLRDRGCGPTLEESVLVIKGSDPEHSLLPDELDAAIYAAMKEMK